MTLRAVFFDEASAEAVLARLVSDGFDAHVVRERLHGEDDEEDHPWAVLTDAPPIVVELLVDHYDGWLDEGEPPPPPQPLDLPAAPRRVKGHFTEGND
jgi:8-oxo-dGTP diphosphatase